MPEETVRCDYEIRQESNTRMMVINCRDCEEIFSPETCSKGIMLSLEKEYNVSSIVISDYVETQYTGKLLELMKSIVELSNELKRLSSRDVDGKDCKGCELNPAVMYPRLRHTLINDTGKSCEYIVTVARAVMKKTGCVSCRRSAKEELTMLGEELLRINSRVLYEAYDVVG